MMCWIKKNSLAVFTMGILLSTVHATQAQQLWTVNHPPNDPHKAAPTNDNKAEPPKKIADPTELLKTINALKDRICSLKENLSRLNVMTEANAGATITTVPTVPVRQVANDLKKQVATLKEEVNKQDGVLSFLRDVEVSGIIDGYYSYNNNKVDLFTQGRAFDVRHNAFSCNWEKSQLRRKTP